MYVFTTFTSQVYMVFTMKYVNVPLKVLTYATQQILKRLSQMLSISFLQVVLHVKMV